MGNNDGQEEINYQYNLTAKQIGTLLAIFVTFIGIVVSAIPVGINLLFPEARSLPFTSLDGDVMRGVQTSHGSKLADHELRLRYLETETTKNTLLVEHCLGEIEK